MGYKLCILQGNSSLPLPKKYLAGNDDDAQFLLLVASRIEGMKFDPIVVKESYSLRFFSTMNQHIAGPPWRQHDGNLQLFTTACGKPNQIEIERIRSVLTMNIKLVLWLGMLEQGFLAPMQV